MENLLKSGKTAMDQSAVEVALLDWCRKTVDGYMLLLLNFLLPYLIGFLFSSCDIVCCNVNNYNNSSKNND